MIDKTTAGHAADPQEVEAVLHNLCGYHLAEPDPLFRYTVLTREQVLYDALLAAIKRERGRALAEIVASGHTLTHVAEMTNLGSRQRVARLIALARAAEAAAAEVQAASLAHEAHLTVNAQSTDPAEPARAAPRDGVPISPGLVHDVAAPGPSPVGATSAVTDGARNADAKVTRDPTAVLEPTLHMPALTAVLNPTKEMPAADNETPRWWHQRGIGAA